MAEITLIGSGFPVPAKNRFGSSMVVQVGKDQIMFDCGPGTTYKMVQAGISPLDVNHLVFTHHHFDHDADYGCFTMTRWNMGNNSAPPLEVLGPDLTTTITDLLFKEDGGVFSYDFKARINHPMSTHSYVTRGLPLPRKPPEVNAMDIGPGKILTGGSWEITAAPAIHAQPYLDSLAYRLDSDEGSIVISGDTGPCESVTKLAKGADVLLHNCTGFQDGMDGTPIGYTNTGTKGAAIVARDAGVKTLVMVHATEAFTPPGMAEKAIAEVAEIFKGKIILGTELMRFPVR